MEIFHGVVGFTTFLPENQSLQISISSSFHTAIYSRTAQISVWQEPPEKIAHAQSTLDWARHDLSKIGQLRTLACYMMSPIQVDFYFAQPCAK